MTNYAHAPTSPPLPPAGAETTPTTGPAGYGRLIAWLALVLIVAGLSFTAQAAIPEQPGQPSSGIYVPAGQEPPTGFGGRKIAPPPDDTFYRYSFALGAIIQSGSFSAFCC